MSQKSKTVVFFGNERLATGVPTTAPTLRKLLAAGYTIAAVVAQYERGKSRDARQLEIAAVAEEHNIPVLLPERLQDIKTTLEATGANAGILVAYGKIIPQDIIDIFPKGIINIHPSLLPKHRGPTPLESVLLKGEQKTGVSIMQLVKAMDAGPVYAQTTIEIPANETKIALANTLLEYGGSMLIEHLPAILDCTLQPNAQDNDSATYDSMIDKNDGIIDWHKPAEQIEREIRAYQLWPKSRTQLGNIDVVISTSQVVKKQMSSPGDITISGKDLFVSCGNGSLQILTLIPAGKKEMPAQAFLAGYVNRIQ